MVAAVLRAETGMADRGTPFTATAWAEIARGDVSRLRAATIWVNKYRATSYTSPFGGYKRSGIGRESGTEAIKQYLLTKCVWISSDLEIPDPFARRRGGRAISAPPCATSPIVPGSRASGRRRLQPPVGRPPGFRRTSW